MTMDPNLALAASTGTVGMTGLAHLAPQWKRLGFPSEQAWIAAGRPNVQYTKWQSQQKQAGPTAVERTGLLTPLPTPTPPPTLGQPPVQPPAIQPPIDEAASAMAGRPTAPSPAPGVIPVGAPGAPTSPRGTTEQAFSSAPYGVPLSPPPTLGQTAQPPAIQPPGAPPVASQGMPGMSADLRTNLLNPVPQPKTLIDVMAEEDPELLAVFRQQAQQELAQGVPEQEVGARLANKITESLQGSATAVGPLARDVNPTDPLSVLAASTAFPEMAGQALQTVARPATEQLPEVAGVDTGAIAESALGLAPLFAAGPTGAISGGLTLPRALAPIGARGAAGLGLAAGAGGELTETLGLGEGVGQLAGPVIGPGVANLARTGAGALGEAATRRLRPEAITVDSVMDQLRAGAAPETLIEQVRRLGPSQRMDLSLRVGQVAGRDAMQEFGQLVTRADVTDARAAQQLASDFHAFRNRYDQPLRASAEQMGQRMGFGPAAGFAGEPELPRYRPQAPSEFPPQSSRDQPGLFEAGQRQTPEGPISSAESAARDRARLEAFRNRPGEGLGRPRMEFPAERLPPPQPRLGETPVPPGLGRERMQFPPEGPPPSQPPTFEGFQPQPRNTLQQVADNIAAVPGALKYTQTSGDIFGFQFRQGMPAAFIDPKAWGRNFSRIGKAYLEDPQSSAAMARLQAEPRFATGELIENVIDASTQKPIVIKPLSQVVNDFQTPGMEKINDSLVQRAAEAIPLAQRSEKGLRVGYLGLANDLRNAMINDAVRAGVTDQNFYDHLTDIALVAVGYGNVPQRLKGISNGFYSLRNIAGRFQMLTKPVTEPGALFDVRLPGSERAGPAGGIFSAEPRGVASRNLTRFAMGETANLRMLAFAGQESGLFDVGWNPLEPGFGSLQFQDDSGATFSTDLIGGWGSYVKAIAKSAAAAAGDSRFDQEDAISEWVKFWRYKAGPAPSLVLDTFLNLTGADELQAFRSPFASPLPIPGVNADEAIKDWSPEQLAQLVLPFFAGEAVSPLLQGILDVQKPEDLLKAGGLLAASWSASQTNLYEPSVFTLSEQMFGGREYLDLGAAEQAQVNVRAVQQGVELEDWQRAAPYGRADDEAFAAMQAENPEALGEYEDLNAFRDALEQRIVAKAAEQGKVLQSQDVDNLRQKVEDSLGLADRKKIYQLRAIAADPEMVDAMQRAYDAGERTFPPSKELRALAEALKADPQAAQQLLDRLEAQLAEAVP